MAELRLNNVKKRYEAVEVLHGVDLHVPDGSFTVFVGPSGCGKSTLLRLICGLETVTAGELVIDGHVVNDVPPAKRGIAMVFQSYALYPHMTVAQNMGYALKLAGEPKATIAERVAKAAAILKLTDYLERKPRQLSGGQRQRVAIGRAIVREPSIFLFDEPLSNLDAALRVEMRIELARLKERLGTTTIYVTHDQTEAMTLADQIVVMNAGRIEQVGSPIELYENPVNRFVATFIGSPRMNIMPAGPLRDRLGGPDAAEVGVRPEHTRLVEPEKGDVAGEIMLVERLGSDTYAYIALPEREDLFLVRLAGSETVKPHTRTGITFDRERLHFFDAEGRSLVAKAARPQLAAVQ
ncbi:ABC transporter ATP-binding protein [Acuticoccus kandeliae]|uniref:ABC transporter ATP-binding protein n=1 Tax=Acuticoccus kandeliae TaxID=2073160 RepID=UPI000D3EE09D|nr:sn-glycerol-3-phosphate ABC transporter ATP-binding protein UgpC [Acuticoccus kandeliae]